MSNVKSNLNKENITGCRFSVRKPEIMPGRVRHICALSVFLVVLFGFPLLCGCGANVADGGVVMELSDDGSGGEQHSAAASLNKTEVPFGAQEVPAETAGMPGKIPDVSLDADMPEGTPADGSSDTQTMYIYVCGAVARPGVYELEPGSRLYEAVELAGGLTEEADEACLNLARQISDGEQVIIWTKEEIAALEKAGKYTPGQSGTETAGVINDAMNTVSESQASDRVNINTATMEELTSVPGIGESRAQAIIAYREANGGFQCIEDIKKVDGIKEGLFSKIRDKITV